MIKSPKKMGIFKINDKIETIPTYVGNLPQKSEVGSDLNRSESSEDSLAGEKITVEKIKMKTAFRLKIDIISLVFIVVFIFSFDIMQGIVNEPEYKKYALIVQSILVSALLGIAVYGALAPALQVYPTYSNKGIMDDIMKGVPYFIIIIASAVINSTFIPGSRINVSDDQMFAAMFSITNAFSEECTFSLFMCSLLFAKSKNKTQLYAYNVLISCLFLAYHLFVYQNPAELLHIFLMRFMLNLSYMKTKRFSVPLIFHVLNNFYAALPILLGGV
jgi:membrane protease YdiL (CAAX protease family)